MNILQEWARWAKENDSTVEIKIEGRNAEVKESHIWIWSRRHMAGLRIPIQTTPADLPELIERKGREQIEGAARAAEREEREGQRLLEWAAEQKETQEAAAR